MSRQERDQEYKCTGNDIFTVYGALVEAQHIVNRAVHNGQDPISALNKHMALWRSYPTLRQAERIYFRCRTEAERDL